MSIFITYIIYICRHKHIKIFGIFDENELDTRFIKASLKRYIAKEPIQIHQDKVMDFFYMQDLVNVLEHYMSEENPPKEFDCAYIVGAVAVRLCVHQSFKPGVIGSCGDDRRGSKRLFCWR